MVAVRRGAFALNCDPVWRPEPAAKADRRSAYSSRRQPMPDETPVDPAAHLAKLARDARDRLPSIVARIEEIARAVDPIELLSQLSILKPRRKIPMRIHEILLRAERSALPGRTAAICSVLTWPDEELQELDKAREQGATAFVSTVSTHARGAQAGPEGGGRGRTGTGGIHLGRPAATRGGVDRRPR